MNVEIRHLTLKVQVWYVKENVVHVAKVTREVAHELYVNGQLIKVIDNGVVYHTY